MRLHRLIRTTVLFASILVLTACGHGGSGGGGVVGGGGGGGGGGSTPTSISGVNTSATFGYYLTNSGGTLNFFDPATAFPQGSPVTLAKAGLAVPAMAGSFDSASKQITDLHADSLVYAAGGGFSRVNLSASAFTQLVTTTLVASVTNPCSASVVSDYANTENSWLVYITAGADATCGNGNDYTYAVQFVIGASALPKQIGTTSVQVLAGTYDPSTGALTGFLVQNGSSLSHYDASFTTSATLIGSGFQSLFQLPNGKFMLKLTSGSNVVFAPYDPAVGIGSSQLTITGTTDTLDVAFDATDFYVADYTTKKIYRLPFSGSSAITTVDEGKTVSTTTVISNLHLTAGRVAYLGDDTTRPGYLFVRTVSKSATSSTIPTEVLPINLSDAASGIGITFMPGVDSGPYSKRFAGAILFYNQYSLASGNRACLVQDDGNSNPSCVGSGFSASWIGYTVSSRGEFGGSVPAVFYMGYNSALNPYTIASYDGGTGALVASLGQVPGATTSSSVQALGNNYYATLVVTAPNPQAGNAVQTNLYVGNATTVNSLLAVTADAAVESLIGKAQ